MKHAIEIAQLISRGALFVVNHSAGKDSQAMLIKLQEIVPAEQLLIVHADLGKVEWQGNLAHIERYAGGLPIISCKSKRTFLQMVEERGMWPSPQQRQCTSDLKRGPIDREVRRFLAAHPQFNGLVVSCMGLRAQESSSRAKAETFKINKRNSIAGREWYDWLPIHELTVDQVFETIAAAGQEPHWAYKAGMSRLSCVFCIMASQHDLRTAAGLRPELYREYVELERKIGHTMNMAGKSLEEVTGITA
jgi:3'-phosphoadenosine 5'-phosphosulfate sulfotransferase (PAPS reductase)/FAD synthetase